LDGQDVAGHFVDWSWELEYSQWLEALLRVSSLQARRAAGGGRMASRAYVYPTGRTGKGAGGGGGCEGGWGGVGWGGVG
jgi:hypothetical protein